MNAKRLVTLRRWDNPLTAGIATCERFSLVTKSQSEIPNSRSSRSRADKGRILVNVLL